MSLEVKARNNIAEEENGTLNKSFIYESTDLLIRILKQAVCFSTHTVSLRVLTYTFKRGQCFKTSTVINKSLRALFFFKYYSYLNDMGGLLSMYVFTDSVTALFL